MSSTNVSPAVESLQAQATKATQAAEIVAATSSSSELAVLRQARITSSSVEGFDQLTAVTQGAINFQLKHMWVNEEKLQTFDLVREDEAGDIHAVMEAPKVQLLLGSDNHAVIFYLNLASGTYQWWKGHGRKAELITEQFSNWRLAFRVNLNLRGVKMEDVPSEIRHRLEHYGQYGVQALLIDFTTANIASFEEKLSFLPGLSSSANTISENASRRADFVNYMHEYLTILSQSDGSHNILGYVPQFINPEDAVAHAPTIPPTALNFQNYPYLTDPTKPQNYVSDLYSGDANAVAHANNNMLIFLEMTNHRPLPSVALNPTANWVVPGDDGKLTDGTIALSRRIFLDGYLLPDLIALNKQFEIVAISTRCYAVDVVKYNVEFDARYGCAVSDKPDSFYAWQPTTLTAPPAAPSSILSAAFPSFASAVAPGTCFVWKWETSTKKKDKDGYSSSLECSSSNWLVIPKGSPQGRCSIYVCGTSSIAAAFKPTFMDGGSTKVQGNWSAEIVFESAIEGGLQVTYTANKLDMTSSRKERLFEGPLGTIETNCKAMVSSLPLENTLATLQELFNGEWQFFFPGGGDFLFKNPLFNYNGDLLLDLTYKGY